MVNTCAMVLLWRWPDGLLFMSVGMLRFLIFFFGLNFSFLILNGVFWKPALCSKQPL